MKTPTSDLSPTLPVRLVSGGLLPAALFSAHATAADRYWDNAAFASQGWNTAANWDANTLPINGDNVFLGPTAPGVAVTTGTALVDLNLSIANLTFTNAANLTAQVQTANTLTLNNVTFNSGVTAGSLTISRLGTGAVALGSNATWDIGGVGSVFTGLTVSAPISGNFSITKSGARALTLSGNNTFDGGIIHRRASIFTSSFTNSGALGNGAFTFGNEAAGANNATNSLSLNNGFTTSYANDFVNDNASANTSNIASLVIGTNAAHFTQTLTGDFSTGANYNSAQSLRISANSNALGTQEGTFVFSGDWSAYNAGTTVNGIAVAGGGTVRLGSAASIAPTNYQIGGSTAAGMNSSTNSTKLILDGAYTMNRQVSFLGDANGMQNAFGTRAAASTVTTLAGDGTNALVLSDNDGANLFAHTAGSTLAVTGKVTGSSTGPLKINDGYTLVSGSSAGTAGNNTLQSAAGTVVLSNGANDFTGGVQVVAGVLNVTNTSGSATGSGSVTVGQTGAANAGFAATGASGSRILTGISNATAQTLSIGQSVSGTGVAGGSVITGISIGISTATVAISSALTAANSSLSTSSFSTTATLGGTGIIAPTGSNGLLVHAASALGLVDGITDDLGIALRGTGSATFSSGSIFSMELGAPGTSDGVSFTGLGDASSAAFNNNVINFTNLGGLAAGSYLLFSFDTADKYTGTLSLGSGLGSFFPDSSLQYNPDNIRLVVVPEPSAATIAGVLLGITLLSRRRRSA